MRPEAGQEGQGDLGLGTPGLPPIPALSSPRNLWQIAFPRHLFPPSAKGIPSYFLSPVIFQILNWTLGIQQWQGGVKSLPREADTEGTGSKRIQSIMAVTVLYRSNLGVEPSAVEVTLWVGCWGWPHREGKTSVASQRAVVGWHGCVTRWPSLQYSVLPVPWGGAGGRLGSFLLLSLLMLGHPSHILGLFLWLH